MLIGSILVFKKVYPHEKKSMPFFTRTIFLNINMPFWSKNKPF